MQTISIIVPVYKVEKYLARCVDSILGQSYKNFELVLVDDGSPDNCGKICDEYAKKDCRVKVVHKKNGGLSSARNAGVAVSSGDWIYFIDSDDWVEENLIEDVVNAIKSNPQTECVLFGYYIDFVLENRSLVRKFETGRRETNDNTAQSVLLEAERSAMFNSTCNKVYKRAIVKENDIVFPENVKTGEDLPFNCKYFSYIQSCHVLSGSYYHYMRQGEATIVTRYDPTLLDTMIKTNKQRIELYEYLNMYSSEEKAVMSKMVISDINSCIFNEARNAENSFSSRKEFFQRLLNEPIIKQAVMELDKSLPLMQRVFKYCYLSGSPVLMSFVYGILFWGRKNMTNTYGFVRKHMLLRK